MTSPWVTSSAYVGHRERVLSAKSMIDHRPPRLNAGNYLKSSKIKEDFNMYSRILNDNFHLMVNLNCIQRTGGQVNTFEKPTTGNLINSQLPVLNNKKRAIEHWNRQFGKRLMRAKASLNTKISRRFLSEAIRAEYTKMQTFDMPTEILQKYEDQLHLPDDEAVLRTVFRPKIYFDIHLRDGRVLGRVLMQLYTEACPEVVLEFVRICKAKQSERIRIERIFQSLWIQGDINMNKEINMEKVEYDMRALNHAASAGIMSISKYGSSRENLLPFAISLKPLNVLNGERIAFGAVIRGQKLLDSLQEYGMKRSGKLMKSLSFSSVGVIYN